MFAQIALIGVGVFYWGGLPVHDSNMKEDDNPR